MPENTTAPAVPAASILLLREQDSAMQVFMVVRHHQIDFASGALVFPGGKADEADFDEALIPHLRGAADDRNMRAIQVAAIREAFEECGILLAYPKGSDTLIDATRLAELDPCREQLNSGELNITHFVEREALDLACDQLVHFSHWVTPEMMPKRFDTHFFLAVAPDDHLAVHDGYESVDSVWIGPQDILEQAEAGKYTVIFPTLRNIEKLAQHADMTGAMRDTAGETIVTVLPRTERREDGNYLTIPENAGYLVTEVRMPDR